MSILDILGKGGISVSQTSIFYSNFKQFNINTKAIQLYPFVS